MPRKTGGYVIKDVSNPQDNSPDYKYEWVNGPGRYIKMKNGMWTWIRV